LLSTIAAIVAVKVLEKMKRFSVSAALGEVESEDDDHD